MDLVNWLPHNTAGVPQSLRDLNGWVAWNGEVRDGKPTKVPKDPVTGHNTDATHATWTYAEAVAGMVRHGFDGVGVSLDANPDLVGVDLDHVRDPETGDVLPGAQAIVDDLGSYTEVSPSGTGLRVFVLGEKPGRRCKREGAFEGFDAEMYDSVRFLTVTGHHVDGTPAEVRRSQPALTRLYERIAPPKKAPKQPREARGTSPSGPTDADVLERARAARNGAKFDRLYGGSASSYDGDESAGDFAFVMLLSFWTQDAAQIDRIVRGSGRMRPKWDRPSGEQTYGERTIDTALGMATETYDWGRAAGESGESTAGEATGEDVPDRDATGDAPAIPERVYALLPPALADAAGRMTAWAVRDAYLTSLLVTLSGALPFVRFSYGRGEYLSTHLFAFLYGPAASGKGVVSLARAWLHGIDDALTQASTAARDAWAVKKAERERLRRSRKRDDQAEIKHLDETDPLGPEPPSRYLLMGEDTTSAGLVDAVHDNPEGVALVSTEADTVTDANGKEHGRFSAIFRKAFHNERHAENRRAGGRLVVPSVRLAVLLAGTLDQVGRLFERGVEDGLFSRFIFHSLGSTLRYESQRGASEDREFDRMTEARAADTKAIHESLSARDVDAEGRTRPLYVDLPEAAWDRMDAAYRGLFERMFDSGNSHAALAATVKRGPVLCYRLASILSVWRAYGAGVDLRAAKSLTVCDDDAEAALLLSLVYVETALRHAEAFSRQYGTGGALSGDDALGGAHRTTAADRNLLDLLPDEFDPTALEAAGLALGISRATAFRRAKGWVRAGLATREKDGKRSVYRKSERPSAPFVGDGMASPPPDLDVPGGPTTNVWESEVPF